MNNPDELNPEHPLTRGLNEQWHKLAAIMLHKMELRGQPEVTITPADIDRFVGAYPEGGIVAHDRADGLHLMLVSHDQAEALAKDETARKPRAVAPVTHGLTDDPTDPRLKRGPDTEPGPQNEVYLVLSEEERAKGFVRPLRRSYRHVGLPGADKYPFDKPKGCGAVTTMGLALCETYAREPKFYGSTYCTHCRKHLPVGEFVWSEDGQVVGS